MADFSPFRVAIAGASSLGGKELKEFLEDTSFPASEIRLFDEDIAVGTLTEAGGEPALIRAVDADSFDRARFVFFTGSPAFSQRHWEAAQHAGATVIDLSGGLAGVPQARRWIPSLDGLLPPRPPEQACVPVYLAPSAPVIVACSMAAALSGLSIERLAIVFFQAASERGQAGVEELENQTIQLLSFQPIAQDVFGTQVAFNLVDRYGESSAEHLADIRLGIAREARCYLEGRGVLPAIQLVQAPVFYSCAFTAYAEFGSQPKPERLRQAFAAAGVKLLDAGEPAPSNISVAGQSEIALAQAGQDPNAERGHWFWGAADNLRLAAANAARIAEKLLAS